MRHHHFKYIRNIVVMIIALVLAGYPYLLLTGFRNQFEPYFFLRGIFIVGIVVISFSAVAYAAHVEHKKREKDEQYRLK